MKKRYRLTAQADESLQEIYHYTYLTFGQRQADRYLLELEAAFERIGDFPEIGSPHLAQTRRLVHGKHVIIYRADTASAVTIIQVFHGSRRR